MPKLRPTQSPTCRRLHAGLEPLELRMVLNAGPLVISELMASNNKTLADETGEFVDWLEITE